MPKVSATHNHRERQVVIVCGPTATGKTKLALSLAHRFNGELINADSRQMYQGMGIISGKDIEPGTIASFAHAVTIKQQKFSLVTHDIGGIPIWLYDVASPDKPLSASHFHDLAVSVIADISARGKLPIIVGGSGFYLSFLFHEFDSLHIPPNRTLRSAFFQETTETLQQTLTVADPVRWNGMNASDRNNPRRLVRALEVASWKKTHTQKHAGNTVFNPLWIGLRTNEEALFRRIQDRVNVRLSSGALEEAKSMQHISQDLPASTTLGLRILLRLLQGEIDANQAEVLWVREEIRYAKRQMVWFKRQKDIRWYDAEEKEIDAQVEKDVRQWYTR
ncbi:MAG: tRNA (adenosine(37)-N6)-dimethylallyltransferase MiaA [Patescibacteria group bacterium]